MAKDLNRLCIEKLTKAGADIIAKNREGLGFLSYLLRNFLQMDSTAYDYARNELKLKYDKIPNLISVISEMRFDYDAEDKFSDALEYAETALKDMLTDGNRATTDSPYKSYILSQTHYCLLPTALCYIHSRRTQVILFVRFDDVRYRLFQ